MPEYSGFWPVRMHTFKAIDPDTGEVIHKDWQTSILDRNKPFVNNMIADVVEKGYYFTSERLQAIPSYYDLDYSPLQILMDLKSLKK